MGTSRRVNGREGFSLQTDILKDKFPNSVSFPVFTRPPFSPHFKSRKENGTREVPKGLLVPKNLDSLFVTELQETPGEQFSISESHKV